MMYLKNILKSSTCIVPMKPASALSCAAAIQKNRGTSKPIRHKGTRSLLLDEKRSKTIISPASKAMLISGASDNAQSHIPAALLQSEDSNSNYLLAEYAGITSPKGRAHASMSKVFSAQKVALKFKRIALKSLAAQSTGTTENGGYRTNLPEFWNDLDGQAKLKLKDLLSWESISRWDFNIFDVEP